MCLLLSYLEAANQGVPGSYSTAHCAEALEQRARNSLVQGNCECTPEEEGSKQLLICMHTQKATCMNCLHGLELHVHPRMISACARPSIADHSLAHIHRLLGRSCSD